MILIPHMHQSDLTLTLQDVAATRALAGRLARLVRPGDIIALGGDLGAGKTTFARAFISALPVPDKGASRDSDEVPSPTFTLVQIYERAPAPVWHFDLYRLDAPEEAYELGFEEALGEGILLIEWPDRLGPLLPSERLDLCFTFAAHPDSRTATLAGGEAWRERLRALGQVWKDRSAVAAV